MSDQKESFTENDVVLLPAKTFEMLVNYLMSKPYKEVASVMPHLQNLKLKKLEDVEPKTEETEPAQ